MSEQVDRSALLTNEIWFKPKIYQDLDTRAYIDVDGSSPETSYHLSSVTYKIIEGVGRIATAHTSLDFDVKSEPESQFEFTIGQAEPHMYEGRFNAFVSFRIPPYAGYTTFNGQKLGALQRKTLRSMRFRAKLNEGCERIFDGARLIEVQHIIAALNKSAEIRTAQSNKY